MSLRNYINFNDYQRKRIDAVYERYKKMYLDPDNCTPMFIVTILASKELPVWEERLRDPIVMLKAQLDSLIPHFDVEDDCVPTVRVQFGTAQMAAAFGCSIFIPQNSLPAAGSHILKEAGDVYSLAMPGYDAGWYSKLRDYTEIFLENLPEGIYIQHPDIQSAFNTAHLIRGNDILLDFFDEPDAVDALLDKVTDYMIKMVPYMKKQISVDSEWFFDWNALWKGAARISNCTMHMISPEFYIKHVLERDKRFIKSVGGGRIHYCGTADEVIDEFFKIPGLSGLDYDIKYHDFWSLCKRAPASVVLFQHINLASDTGRRLLNGDWPEKKNLIIEVSASSVEEGRDILKRLRGSVI